MTIKIELVANDAAGLASKLHELVQTFVILAKSTEPAPFDTTTTATAEEKPKRKPRAAPVIDGNAKEEPAEEAEEVTPDMVREVLNQLRKEKGNDALGSVVTQFAPKFSEIPQTSYPKLFALAKKALAA